MREELRYYPERNITAYCGKKYTLLPLALHTINKIDELLAFNHPLAEGETVRQDCIGDLNVFNIYAIPKALSEEADCHQATVFIENSVKRRGIERQVFIDVYPDFFYACLTKNGRLLFSNAFEYADTEEFVYFVLNLYDKFDLIQLETPLIVSGEIRKKDKRIAVLKEYLKYIEL